MYWYQSKQSCEYGRNIEKSCNRKRNRNIFLKKNVSSVTPDTKKSAKNPSNPLDIQPIRYQLGPLKVLFSKFCSESTSNTSYAIFCWHVPFYITSPSATDWGTCFCSTCLNPQLKIEKLCRVDKTLLFAPLDENVEQDEDFSQLLETLKKYQFKDITSIQSGQKYQTLCQKRE